MSRDLSHILAAVFTTPWLMEPRKGRALAQVVLRRAAGERLSAYEIEERVGDERVKFNARLVAAAQVNAGQHGVHVVPLIGSLVHRGAFENTSGMTSTELVGAKLRAAYADPNVRTIVLDVDSPGGEVSGTLELADLVANSPKPTVAIANSWAASAAYWIASQADEVVVTPSGEVGSIGVLMIHDDESKLMETEGITRTVIAAGDHKGELWGPLTEEARAHLQEQADQRYRQFVAAVADGRGVSAAKVRADFGGGRMLLPEAAKAAGMVDRIATYQETLDRLVAGGRVRRRRASAWSPDEPAHRAAALDLE